MKPDIIFIGAGPIGLLGAIQVKLTCPDKEVLMFEKYLKPMRAHAMYVDKASFAKMDRSNGFGDVLDSIPTKVVISDLEETLRDYATKIGIKIEYKEITDFKQLQDEYLDTQYVVGSGGLNGIMHPQVFKGENQIKEPLRYAAEVKYKVKGPAQTLNKLTELPGVFSYTQHLVSEYVGHTKNDITPISLRIFVSQNTYDMMKNATFKNPYTLAHEDKIDPELLKTINVYLKGRKHLTGEMIVEDSLKISMITLSIYASKDFCKQVDGKTIFQIGEEAFACPFYRSFNDNASCIPAFAKTVKALFDGKNIQSKKINSSLLFSTSKLSSLEKSPTDPIKYYQAYVQNFINREIRTIRILNSGIDMLELGAMSSRSTPSIPRSKLKLNSGGRTFLNEVNGNPKKQDKTKQDGDISPTVSYTKTCTLV